MTSLDILLGLFAAILGYGVHLFFRDRREARSHKKQLTDEFLAKLKPYAELDQTIVDLDRHVKTSLENYKNAMVIVLQDMREIVKATESERQRVAGVAAATLLRPGRDRRPQP